MLDFNGSPKAYMPTDTIRALMQRQRPPAAPVGVGVEMPPFPAWGSGTPDLDFPPKPGPDAPRFKPRGGRPTQVEPDPLPPVPQRMRSVLKNDPGWG